MAKRETKTNLDRLANLPSTPIEERVEPRPTRSRRGLAGVETSQVCFKIEAFRHHALRLYCVENRREIGEVLSELMEKHLGI